MPQDNVGYTPGSGAVVAARDVTYSGEAALAQAVGLVTFAGADDAKTATDVGLDNGMPVQGVGELMEAIEALRFSVVSLTRTIGMALPNAQGFPIMEARQATAGNLNATAVISSGTVTTVTTLTTLTNQSQIGGFATNDQIPSLMHMQADNLRRNIAVT
jgi:hypothetical protein